MSEEQKALKAFLHVTRLKADVVLNAAHINNEAKVTIKDLLQICNNFEVLLSSNVGVSADTNLLKKRYDHSKQEIRKLEDQVNIAKEKMQTIVPEIVKVSTETNTLLKGIGSDTESALYKALIRIKHSLAQMAEAISKSK